MKASTGKGFSVSVKLKLVGPVTSKVTVTPETFEMVEFDEPIDVPLYQFGIFGAILVLVMLFRPEGLIPSARRKAEFGTAA